MSRRAGILQGLAELLKCTSNADSLDSLLRRFSLVMKDKELFFTARNAEECSSWIENLAVGKEASTGNFTSAHSSGVSALMF